MDQPGGCTLIGAVLGNASQMAERGECDGPDFFQLDLSFYKRIPLGERIDGQLRFEIFNVTNQINYIAGSIATNTTPFNVVYDAPLGQATRIVSADFADNWGEATAARDPRQVQLGFKLSF